FGEFLQLFNLYGFWFLYVLLETILLDLTGYITFIYRVYLIGIMQIHHPCKRIPGGSTAGNKLFPINSVIEHTGSYKEPYWSLLEPKLKEKTFIIDPLLEHVLKNSQLLAIILVQSILICGMQEHAYHLMKSISKKELAATPCN
ncbi:hypothetical protein ACJX0J_036596, partial [Zea mays]